MAHTGARALHSVTDNQPKVLAGWSHKGPVTGPRLGVFLVMGPHRSRWKARASPPRLFRHRPMATPSGSQQGQHAVRRAPGGAGRSGGRQRRPPCHGVERGGATGNLPPREREQTSRWACVPRALGAPRRARRQRTAVPPPGARSTRAAAGHTLAWYMGHRPGRRLQARRVQAVPAGRWGTGRAWPPRLTPALSGTALAGKGGPHHAGPRPSGGDGVSWAPPEQTPCAPLHLRHRGARAPPLRRLSMPKNGPAPRWRPWALPTRPARALPALSGLAREPRAATPGAPHASGCRTERSPAEALGHGGTVLAHPPAAAWSLAGDRRAGVDGLRPAG